MNQTRRQLLKLAEALVEDRASEDSIAELEKLVLSSPECLEWYLEFMELHGNLYWDAAGNGADLEQAVLATVSREPVTRKHSQWRIIGSLAASLLVLASLSWVLKDRSQDAPALNQVARQGNPIIPDGTEEPADIPEVHLPDRHQLTNDPETTLAIQSELHDDIDTQLVDVSNDAQVVGFINQELAAGWQNQGLIPSPRAAETEWIRRVYLDLAGRIPTRSEVETYLADHRPERRERLVDMLLLSREYASNFASIWTNLLVGRSKDREIDRDGLFAYLESQFGENHPWSETVSDLVAATGAAEESGPANFLLAHLNNEAVPATAITARIFLCEQMQCSQCHIHPNVSSWGQEKFWEFNAFFHDTDVKSAWVTDERTGRKTKRRELVDVPPVAKPSSQAPQPVPTFYESLNGVMQVAYPRFAGEDVLPSSQVTLREQLADRLTSPENSQFAIAFVNRHWSHFFGHGFTRQVDDMGPHSAPSHPALLAGLGNAFAATGYDVRRLMKWICLSDAYQLSSVVTEENELDDPDAGDLPFFSRMYVKPLSPEQLFNSLMIAAGIPSEQLLQQSTTLEQRDAWLQQFFVAAENEENNELSTFDGSLPQTLMMMNGDLIQQAVDVGQSAVLRDVVEDPRKSERDRIRELCLAALSRYPTDEEVEAIHRVLRQQIRQRTSQEIPAKVAVREGFRDLYWAYLNSSEFLVNH